MSTHPFVEPPFDPERAPIAGDERDVVCWMLDYYRWVLLRKLDGLSEQQARMTTAKSDLTLLGLARHMGGVEQYWFDHIFLGNDPAWHYDDADDPDIDFHYSESDTLGDAVENLIGEIARARQTVASTDFDALAAIPRRAGHGNLRFILVHMIEEYARHCGHADLLREAVDGRTGD